LPEREAELLPVPYYHLVFTPAGRDRQHRLPEQGRHLRPLVQSLLLRKQGAAAETLITIAADPKHLGARIGLTAVLRTWGSALTHHRHVHIIVPGGGISPDGSVGSPAGPASSSPCAWSHGSCGGWCWRSWSSHDAGRLQFFGDRPPLGEALAARLTATRVTLNQISPIDHLGCAGRRSALVEPGVAGLRRGGGLG
jgi:hypothetical protein